MAAMPTPALNSAGYTVGAPVVPKKPITGYAVATTANSTYTDTPTNSVAFDFRNTSDAGAVNSFPLGCRIEKLTALARATATATELQLFASKDGGTTKRFIDSALGAAYTVAQTTKQTKVDFGFSASDPLVLDNGEILYFAVGVTNTGWVARASGSAW